MQTNPIYQQVVQATGIEPRCPHNNTWTTRGRRGGCLNCGQCFHTVIVRENPGSNSFPFEARFCDDCGTDLDHRMLAQAGCDQIFGP